METKTDTQNKPPAKFNADNVFARIHRADRLERERKEAEIKKSQQAVRKHINQLRKASEKLQAGNLAQLEQMLTEQAGSLNSLYCYLITQSINERSYLHSYLPLALKAQNLCRKTAIAAAEIKNPSNKIFITNEGNQQVNLISEKKDRRNELLCKEVYETVDTGRTTAAIPANQELAAVE